MKSLVNWDAHEAALQELWTKGQTASQIAATLGHGITRNAVIGKIHRLKLQSGLKLARPNANRQTAVKLHAPWARNYREPGLVSLSRTKNPDKPGLWQKTFSARQRTAFDLHPEAVELRRLRVEGRVGHLAPPLPRIDVMLAFADGYNGQQGRVAILDLKDMHCRFPVDMADGAVKYCGLNKEQGGSYCPAHAVRCVGHGVRT